MFIFDIPRKAVECFEHLSGLQVSIHTYEPLFTAAFPDHHIHPCGYCREVKKTREKECVQFDMIETREQCGRFPEGCLKICHAGVLEWVIPVLRRNKVEAVIFAGVRGVPETLPAEIPVLRAPHALSARGLEPAKDIAILLEALRQLALRLERWLADCEDDESLERNLSRDEYIRFLIRRECTDASFDLKKLAGLLHLSESRTAHLVREQTDERFKQILTRFRLDFAERLLEHGSGTVAQIVDRAGFSDVSSFHRAFFARRGTTPRKYRAETAAESREKRSVQKGQNVP